MTTAVHPYVESLLTGTRELARTPHAWLNERRAAALERANALAVPTTRDEEWRFTDLTPLTRLQFGRVQAAGEVEPTALAALALPEAGARLVFVDGVFAPQLSQTDALDSGVRVRPLAQAFEADAPRLESHLARVARFDENLFVALNTAHLREAAVVIVPRDCACEKAVHVLYIATQPRTVSYPRCLAVAEAGAACTLVEEHVGFADDAYFANAVTEVVVGANAKVRHVKLQREAGKAFHIGACAVALGKDAAYLTQTLSLGARLSRYELAALMQSEGAQVEIDGLALISGRQLADTHTLIDHASANGRSRQLHKTIVGEAAHAVFNGKIYVRHGAQLTDSAQESRNLLLSDKAQVDTKPQLEIFADDVKCAHGATVGQLDPEQLFYLRSRGLSDETARNLLTYAFGASVIQRVPVPSLVARLKQAIMAQTRAA